MFTFREHHSVYICVCACVCASVSMCGLWAGGLGIWMGKVVFFFIFLIFSIADYCLCYFFI